MLLPMLTVKQTRQRYSSCRLNLGGAYKLPIELTETECLSIRIGLMPLSTDVQEVENELEAAGLPSVVQCVNKDKEQMYVNVWYLEMTKMLHSK